MNHEPHGLRRMALAASAALGLGAAAAQAATSYSFNDGVVVALQPASGTTVTVAAPAAGAAFQGIGTNLGQLGDMGYIPCAQGSTGCSVAPAGAKISAKSVRASINLPFNAQGSWYLVNQSCTPVTVTGLGVKFGDPRGTLAFFDTYGATTFYSDAQCSSGASMQDRFGSVANCADTSPTNYRGACLMDGVRMRNLDWVEVYFAAPAEFMQSCGNGCDKLLGDTASMQNFAMYKAAQLVYQGRFGNAPAAPKYVELFNEPEGTWNVQVTPAQYDQFVGYFMTAMQSLVAQRLKTAGLTQGEKTYLGDLQHATVLAGPALGSGYLLDYAGDSAPWDTSKDWFGSATEAADFYATLGADNAAVSTHLYDDKRTGAQFTGLNVMTGLAQLLAVRNASSSNAAVVISEAAETVQNDDVAVNGYRGFCDANTPRNDKKSTEGACDAMRPGDPASVGYSYPDCIPGATYVSSTAGKYAGSYKGTVLADFCHHQAAKLYRNLANYANQNDQHATSMNGVVSELIWASSPTPSSSEHGLVTRQGLASLMNVGTDPLLANFSADGYATVFPVTFAQDFDLGAGIFASAAANPQRARLALANTASVTKTVTLNFGSTPLRQFTRVLDGSSFGGTSDKYTGQLEPMAAGVQAPAGSNFGSRNYNLVVTLPANSAVTLTLAP
jgi:hypothetical protein